MRLKTYALPGVKAWIDEALAEKDFRDFEEPYSLVLQSGSSGTK